MNELVQKNCYVMTKKKGVKNGRGGTFIGYDDEAHEKNNDVSMDVKMFLNLVTTEPAEEHFSLRAVKVKIVAKLFLFEGM